MTRVLVVDDHAVVRHGIRHILEKGCANIAVEEAASGEEAIRKANGAAWDLVILDLSLPDRSGLDVLKQLKTEYHDLPVLVLTMHSEDQYAVRALKNGASGFLTKEGAPEQLVVAVKRILAGGKYLSPSLAERLADYIGSDLSRQAAHEILSDREFEVLSLMVSGKSLTEIGQRLCVSIKTVSTHRARILQKMGLKNNAELVQYAVRHGLIG
jgi:DNA-binding NarL/FixJ family response regulator